MLIDQQPSLVSHIQKKYDHAGKSLFEDVNAWVALREIFLGILADPDLKNAYFVIDALDECLTGLPELLKLIMQTLSKFSQVKWIVSSRNWMSIERELNVAQRIILSLELNEQSISSAVVNYIYYKVDCLAKRNKYSSNTQNIIQDHLLNNASGTFLWVALVCEELSKISAKNAKRRVTMFPPGLDALYRRMMDQIRDLEDAEDAKICYKILAVVSTVYRPITLDELSSIIDIPDDDSSDDDASSDNEALTEIIALCGSILTLRDRTIAFVHQSAKDYLVNNASNEIYPLKKEHVHYTIFLQSLQVMSRTLRHDIYNLAAPGFPIHQVKQPIPDPLSLVRYSCVYWINHLIDYKLTTSNLQDGERIEKFLQNAYLYWLEALSLSGSITEGIISIIKLKTLLHVTNFHRYYDTIY
jgi:hypothetical protein